ncbi:uncharacterized protein TrAFT101_007248 [Trichoderma asperellum]|uniref:uncharacterized protein n=1 Tax=Trichoderma asperellum TaxID=101201 RepID=UPI00331BD777|nr:hypothetical protein TrAFT101_007248 [Trichoderma asperellum]
MEAVGNTANIPHVLFHLLVHAQRAREFEDEFERHQLRLDILQVRLSRQIETLSTLGNAAEGNNGTTIQDNERSLAEILAAVQQTLFKAQRDATKMRAELAASTTASSSGAADAGSGGGDPPLGEQPARLRALAFLEKRRLQTAKAIGIMQWVIYKRDRFNRSIADIAALVADVETLASNQESERL